MKNRPPPQLSMTLEPHARSRHRSWSITCARKLAMGSPWIWKSGQPLGCSLSFPPPAATSGLGESWCAKNRPPCGSCSGAPASQPNALVPLDRLLPSLSVFPSPFLGSPPLCALPAGARQLKKDRFLRLHGVSMPAWAAGSSPSSFCPSQPGTKPSAGPVLIPVGGQKPATTPTNTKTPWGGAFQSRPASGRQAPYLTVIYH